MTSCSALTMVGGFASPKHADVSSFLWGSPMDGERLKVEEVFLGERLKVDIENEREKRSKLTIVGAREAK